MASFARIDELKKKFDENPRRYFAPLANEFRKIGEIEQAIMICEEFLPQQPGHMSGHIVYGQALFEAGRFAESRTVFETALTLDPENLIALRHLGDIARGQGDLESARRWYDRVLEADPRNEEIQTLLGSLGGSADGARPAAPPAELAESGTSADVAFDEPPPAAAAAPAAPAEQRFAPPPPPNLPLTPPPRPPAPEPLDIEFGELPPSSAPTVRETAPQPFPPSLEGLEPTSTAEMNAFRPPRAEGLEPTEFAPPERPVQRDAQLVAGEFIPPAAEVAPLPGLESTSAGGAHSDVQPNAPADARRVSPPDLPPLDLDEGLTLPPHGDGVASAQSPTAGLPMLDEGPAGAPAQPHELPPPLPPEPSAELPPELPTELPPPVIAAEAELIDAAVPPAPQETPQETPQDRERRITPVAPFLTETMAELYLKQGFREQAYDVYRRLLAANPDNPRLREKVAELAPRERPPAETGPSVRDFFARLAARRPGLRAAAAEPPAADDFAALTPAPADFAARASAPDDFAAPTPAPAPAPASAPAPGAPGSPGAVPPAMERAASIHTPAGSIDALFGSRPVGTSEDSAASALAQAFGGAAESAGPPAITGRPARAAAGELSLDSVFRDGSARPPRSQGFSFDQFFAESAATPPEAGTPAPEPAPSAEPASERSADDIEQFNSWLQGLKQR